MIAAAAPFNVNLGDVPTWLAVVAAAGAAFIALRALRAQNSETARQVAALERQQADRVDVRPNPVAGPIDLKAGKIAVFHWGTTVDNGSRRPIRNIAARLDTADGTALTEPAEAGLQLGDAIRWKDISILALLRSERAGGFRFTVTMDEHPQAMILVRFTDDAGLHWQIDHNLHLQKLERREW